MGACLERGERTRIDPSFACGSLIRSFRGLSLRVFVRGVVYLVLAGVHTAVIVTVTVGFVRAVDVLRIA